MHHPRIVNTLTSLFIAIMLAACGGNGYGGGSGNGYGGGGGAGGGTWGAPQLLEANDSGDARRPQIAVNSNGNVVAVWTQSDGTRDNIWANRFDPTSGAWGVPQLIETDNASGAFVPQVALNTNGNAIAVWQQSDGAQGVIWANRFNAASGTWGTAEPIMPNNPVGGAFDPQIAMDGNGNAIAVWSEYDGTRNNIWANRFSAASGTWGTAQLIEGDNAGGAFVPQIALNTNGNAVAVWTQSDGTRVNIRANRFNAASGSWGTAEPIMPNNPVGDAFDPQIAIDDNGNAIAVWSEDDGAHFNTRANRFNAANGTWGTVQLIETDNAGHAFSPQIAVNSYGNAIAVWYQFTGTDYDIWANRFNAASGTWGAPQLIETNGSGNASRPQIALDTGGNAVAVWQQPDGTRDNIWANRFNAASDTWGTAQLIEGDNAGDAGFPQIEVDSYGNAIAVWQQSDGTRNNIWSNRFQLQ